LYRYAQEQVRLQLIQMESDLMEKSNTRLEIQKKLGNAVSSITRGLSSTQLDAEKKETSKVLQRLYTVGGCTS
jgi:Trp operon repressor